MCKTLCLQRLATPISPTAGLHTHFPQKPWAQDLLLAENPAQITQTMKRNLHPFTSWKNSYRPAAVEEVASQVNILLIVWPTPPNSKEITIPVPEAQDWMTLKPVSQGQIAKLDNLLDLMYPSYLQSLTFQTCRFVIQVSQLDDVMDWVVFMLSTTSQSTYAVWAMQSV